MLQKIRDCYAGAEGLFLEGRYGEVGNLCDRLVNEVETMRAIEWPRLPVGKRELKDKAEEYALRANRLKRTAERLTQRLEAAKEFAALKIQIQSVIWREGGPSWAVVQERVFKEEDIVNRTPVPGLSRRVYVDAIEPHAVVFLFYHGQNLYRFRREIGAEPEPLPGSVPGGRPGGPPTLPSKASPAKPPPARPAVPAKPAAGGKSAPAKGGMTPGLTDFFGGGP
jgi:hypothetical protein